MMATAAQIIGGAGKKTERDEHDFYATTPDAINALIHLLLGRKLIEPGAKIVEPCCGDGAISSPLEGAGFRVFSSDLIDRGYGHTGIDFRSYPPLEEGTWVVTNPPFKLFTDFAKTFIVKRRGPVALLLKSTFWHAESRSSLFRNHRPAFVLALQWRPNMKPEKGKGGTMDFVWVIWNTEPSAYCVYDLLDRP